MDEKLLYAARFVVDEIVCCCTGRLMTALLSGRASTMPPLATTVLPAGAMSFVQEYMFPSELFLPCKENNVNR
jgi:hypothetical protein